MRSSAELSSYTSGGGKLGFLEGFYKRQKENSDDANSSAANINRLGMTVLSDEKLLVRIGVYESILKVVQTMNADEDAQTLTEIEKVTHQFNSMLHQVAIPWGRAGDSYYYGEAMKGWSTLHTRMMDMIQAAKKLNAASKASDVVKKELDQKVFHFFTTVYLCYALLLAEISWYGDDVRPSWSTVIQQPTPVAQPRGQSSYQKPVDMNEADGGKGAGN